MSANGQAVARRCLLVAIVLGASHGGESAADRPSAQHMQQANVLFVAGRAGIYGVPVAADNHTVLDFPVAIKEFSQTRPHPKIDVRKRGKRLRIVPAPDAPKGAQVNVYVDFSLSHATFDFVVGSKDKAEKLLEVIPISKEALEAEARRIAEPEIARAEAKGVRERLQVEAIQLLREIAGSPVYRSQLVPIYQTKHYNDSALVSWSLLAGRWDEKAEHLLIPFDITNSDPKPFRLAKATATANGGNEQGAVVVHVQKASGGDQTGIITTIGYGERVRGVIAVKPTVDGTLKRLDIELSEPNNARRLGATITSWNILRVAFHATTAKERFMREVRADMARRRRAKQLIIGPRVSYGACWIAADLDDGVEGEGFEATSCTALGVRVVKGFFESVAVEIVAVGAWTGNADFDGVTFNGESGDLTRSATFVRVTAGGLLRFGRQTIPYLRFGIGMQGTSYDSQFTVDSTAKDGPDTGFDFNLVGYVGGGLEFRFGERILLGASASGITASQGRDRSFEVGAYVAIGWDSATPDDDG